MEIAMHSRYFNKVEAEKAKAKMVQDEVEAIGKTDWTFEIKQASDQHYYIVAFDNQGEFIGAM
jgi:ribosomal protein S6